MSSRLNGTLVIIYYYDYQKNPFLAPPLYSHTCIGTEGVQL